MGTASAAPVRTWLLDLQERICAALEAVDGEGRFAGETLEGERGGLARPRVLEEGAVLEKAAVSVSAPRGDRLPEAASGRHPDLAGQPFEAVSLSLIVHPRNPHAPTTHANFRAFFVGEPGAVRRWWFGGGYDLTPFYGYVEDCVHWHATARDACSPHGAGLYERLKAQCDRYFHLPHRGEPRGIGGVFLDDHDEGGFDGAFSLVRDLGESFLPAYLPILERRKDMAYGERERAWQLMRRGRYVEFNLVHDRGTRYGLQSGVRIESVLASLPPLVRWRHRDAPESGTPEADLLETYLVPRDWLAEETG